MVHYDQQKDQNEIHGFGKEIDSESDDDQETTDTDDDRYVDDVTQKADFVGYDFVSNIHRRGSEGQDLTSIILVHSFYDLHGLLN